MPKGPSQPPSLFERWGLLDTAAWFMGAHVFAIVTVLLARLISGSDPSTASMPVFALGASGIWIGYLAGPLINSRRKGHGPVADYGATIKIRDIPIGFSLGIFAQIVLVAILYWPILQILDIEDPSESAKKLTDRADGAVDVLLLIVLVVVIAPLTEELFYRGMLLGALRRRLGDWGSILLSAAVFAVIHFQPVSLPGLFLFGIIAGLLRVQTGRLGPCWLFHAGFNATTLFVLFEPWEKL